MERAQISSLVQYGVVKYFSKPIKFDVFFEAIGKIIRANLSMDTTPCVLEIHHNGNVIFVEVAQGLNREKISLLKYKISEMIDNYKIKDPKVIVMMTNLQLSFVDGINLELLLDTVLADNRIQSRNVKILSLDDYMNDFIDGHVEYIGVKVLKDLTSALGSIVGKGQAAGAGDNRVKGYGAKLLSGFGKKVRQRFLDVGKMPFIIGKKYLICRINDCDFDCRGTDVDSKAQL